MSQLECTDCGVSFLRTPGCAQLCETCGCEHYPPLRERKRWSPLALGLLSLGANIGFVPSFLAVRRGIADLRELGRREGAGLWRREHMWVRDRAVLGLVAGSITPLLLVVTALSFSYRTRFNPDVHERMERDELAEVLPRLHEEAHRELALRHLDELAPGLRADEYARVISEADRLDLDTRARVLVPLLEHHAHRPETLERLPPLYHRLEPASQDAALESVATSSAPNAMNVFVTLATSTVQEDGSELDPEEDALLPHPEFPREAIEARGDPSILGPLLTLPDDHDYRYVAYELAAAWCRGSGHDLSAVGSTLIATIGTEPDPFERRDRQMSILALGCVRGPAAERVLRAELEREAAPLAVEALLHRGADVSDATIRRLASTASGLYPLYLALARVKQEARIPPARRTGEALARSRAFGHWHAQFPDEPLRVRARKEVVLAGQQAEFFLVGRWMVGPIVTEGLPPDCDATGRLVLGREPVERPLEVFDFLVEQARTECEP